MNKGLDVRMLLVALVLLVPISVSIASAEANSGMSAGKYAEMVALRMLSLAGNLIAFEDEVIFRLQRKREVDKQKVVARIISARMQFVKLLKLSSQLQKKMSSSDPHLAKVQSLRQRLFYFVILHQKKIAELKKLENFTDLQQQSDKLIKAIKDKRSGLIDQSFSNLENAF